MPPNPNLPPAAANVLHSPIDLEKVPEVNQEWVNEVADRSELDTILTETRKIERDTVSAEEFDDEIREQYDLARRTNNPHLKAFHEGHAQRMEAAARQSRSDRGDRRLDTHANILQLARRSNPSALLATLEREGGMAAKVESAADLAANKAADDAKKNNDRHQRAEVLFRAATRHGSDRYTIDALRTQAGHDWLAAHKTSAHEEVAARTLKEHNRYPGAIGRLVYEINNEYQDRWDEAEQLNQDIVVSLRHWGIQEGRAYARQEDDVRDMLEDYQRVIDSLPVRDTARAEAVANYTRLRFRLESRCINDDILSGSSNPARAYTEDRGIRLHTDKGDLVVHEDGSTERPDVSGVWSRRTASGELWQPTTTELVIDPRAPVEPLNSAFNRWEETRTPEAAAAAYASLGEFIGQQSITEGQHTNTIYQLTEQIRQADDIIATAPATLASEQRALAVLRASVADPTAVTAKEQKAIDAQAQRVANIRGRLDQARTERPILEGRRSAEADARRLVREQLNPARYWHGYLEINSERRVAEVRGGRMLGRLAAGREAQRATDALPAEPIILSDGRLVFDTATVNNFESPTPTQRQYAIDNGLPIPEWHMWADGTSAVYDLRNRRTAQFYPDGTRV